MRSLLRRRIRFCYIVSRLTSDRRYLRFGTRATNNYSLLSYDSHIERKKAQLARCSLVSSRLNDQLLSLCPSRTEGEGGHALYITQKKGKKISRYDVVTILRASKKQVLHEVLIQMRYGMTPIYYLHMAHALRLIEFLSYFTYRLFLLFSQSERTLSHSFLQYQPLIRKYSDTSTMTRRRMKKRRKKYNLLQVS